MRSGLSAEFILRASMCREPHCATYEKERGTLRRTQESAIECLGYAPDYAEPGYTAGERGILLCNWNYFPGSICDILERAGFSIEWEDEWEMCSDCGKLVRTSPDCYSWQRSYTEQDGEILCNDCTDWSEYLESIEDDPNRACLASVNPEDYGYQRISEPSEYENGFHPGQNDKPADILKRLHESGHSHIVFRVPETSQFYITFETWEKAA